MFGAGKPTLFQDRKYMGLSTLIIVPFPVMYSPKPTLATPNTRLRIRAVAMGF